MAAATTSCNPEGQTISSDIRAAAAEILPAHSITALQPQTRFRATIRFILNQTCMHYIIKRLLKRQIETERQWCRK